MTYLKYAKTTIVLYAIYVYCTCAANDASDKYDSLTSSRSRMWRCFSIPEKRERNHAGWPGREVGWRWDEKNFAALFRRWSLSLSLSLFGVGFVGKQKQSERGAIPLGRRAADYWMLGAVNRLGAAEEKRRKERGRAQYSLLPLARGVRRRRVRAAPLRPLAASVTRYLDLTKLIIMLNIPFLGTH